MLVDQLKKILFVFRSFIVKNCYDVAVGSFDRNDIIALTTTTQNYCYQ